MPTTDELKDKFSKLTDEEKVAFMKSVMPSFCEIFSKNPEMMMAELMPLCLDIIRGFSLNPIINQMKLTYDPSAVSMQQIEAAVKKAGAKAVLAS